MEGALIEKDGNVVGLSDHELAAHLGAIIEASDDAISSSNLEGRLLTWNRGATRLYGWAAVDALKTDRTLFIPAELLDFEERISQRVLRGEVDVSINVSATRDSAGRISGVAQISRDLSERRKAEQMARLAEERLSQAPKTAALTSGAAHDFNNLLTIIVTYSSLVLEALEPDSPLRSDLVEIHQAGARASELTRELWTLGRAPEASRNSETILLGGAAAQESTSPRGGTKNCA
jgi:PAS domain S-box-containing protein